MQILGFCLAIFFLAYTSASGCFTTEISKQCERCEIAFDCRDEEKPVWTTSDDRFCEVFRNKCLMVSKNCELVNQNKPEYREISKTKCQELCREMVCLAVEKLVCGSYNNKLKQFGNDCEMKRHICTTGETYTVYREGPCPK